MPYEAGVPGYPMYPPQPLAPSVDTFAEQHSLYGSTYSLDPYGRYVIEVETSEQLMID